MPDKVIDIPGHGQVAFPDSMSEMEINAAATKLYKQANPDKKQPPVKSWVDTAVDWLPAAGGAVGGLVGGIGGTAFGMVVGGAPGAVGGATLGAAGGEAWKQIIQDARGKGTPKTRSEAATDIATAGVVQGALPEVGGAVLGRTMAAAAPRLMQSAVKPTIKMLKGVMFGEPVPRVVQTLLDEGINVTPGGVAKLNGLLSADRQMIKNMLATAEASGAEISPHRVASRLNDTAKTFSEQAIAEPDLQVISEAGNQFLKERGGEMLSPTAAQKMKQGTYAQLRKKYGQLGSAETESQKALARGVKEELETAAPGIDAANAAESKHLEALNAVGKRVALSGNRDEVGFAWVAHNPTTFLLALMDRSPVVKSMLAHGLYKSAGAAAKVSPDLIRAAMGALAASHDTSENE